MSPHLAEDICVGSRGLAEDHPDLARILVPHAGRLLAALAPGSPEPAEALLWTLASVGEVDVVRRMLGDPSRPATTRVVAAEALFERAPISTWEAEVSRWLRDPSTPVALRRNFVRNHRDGPDHDDKPTREASSEAWHRLLLEVARGAEEPALAAEAWRILGDTVGR